MQLAEFGEYVLDGHSWKRLDIELFQGFVPSAMVGIDPVGREMERNAGLLLQAEFGFLLIHIIILLDVVRLAPFVQLVLRHVGVRHFDRVASAQQLNILPLSCHVVLDLLLISTRRL